MWRAWASFVLASLGAVALAVAPGPARVTHDSEYVSAEEFLAKTYPVSEHNYFRFFTTFAVPERWTHPDTGLEVALRKECELALPFVLNSCMSVTAEGVITKPKRVPGSDTLWFIDIRDFGWKADDLDAIFKLQPYFLTPLVDGKNPVLMYRADWFVVYASDNTWVDDRGIKDVPYYILLYGKGREPKDADEFRKFWQVDIKTIRAQRVETGTVVDQGDSGVSQHTRQLRRGKTIFGYYWETRDVKSHDIDQDRVQSRDYIEDIFANQTDAGEYIASHKNGLQVYLLSAGNNDKFKRVEFGDPTVVVDRQDRRDPRVRTFKSCAVCHADGIIPYTNAIADIFRMTGRLYAKDKDLSLLIQKFYLDNDGSEVEDDNRLFSRSVKKCNGLDPRASMKAYLNVYEWYSQKVTPAQAALECGLPPDDFRQSIRKTTTGRLTMLFHGKPIPRDVWDSPFNGGYVQSVLLVKNIQAEAARLLEKAKGVGKEEAKPPPPKPKAPREVESVVDRANVHTSPDETTPVTVYLQKGAVGEFVKDAGDWYQIKGDGWAGYVKKSLVKVNY